MIIFSSVNPALVPMSESYFLNLDGDCTRVTKSCRINEIIFVSDKEHCMDNLPKKREINEYF